LHCLSHFDQTLLGSVALSSLVQLVSLPPIATAQVPVATDDTTATQVTSSDNRNFTVQEGTLRGGSLFHSFQTFSVPTGGSVQFDNRPVTHIFARVTGSSISNIDGLIGANGNANLILINPQGIQFGPNASLQIGGSFLGSTADAIVFRDQQQFSAVSPQSAPILTISTPIGLQFGPSPNPIEVKGLIAEPGLSVKPQRTLALVGGEVTIDNSLLTAVNGQVEIASIASEGRVSLTTRPDSKGWRFGYNHVSNFGNIQLLGNNILELPVLGSFKQGSSIVTSFSEDDVSGDIHLWGQNIQIRGGSQLQAANPGPQAGGRILLNATESVEVVDRPIPGARSLPSGLFTATVGRGPAGNITINARNLKVSGETVLLTASASAQFVNGTFMAATGTAGDIQLNIADTITVSDGAAIGSSSAEGLGTAGHIELNTRVLNVVRGGRIESFTTSPNPAGEIRVNASELVSIAGSLKERGLSSSLLTVSQAGSTGRGGPITINTDRLQVTKGGVVSAQTKSTADAGAITIDANQVRLLDGGQLISTTSSRGAAGQVQLTVRDRLTISGRDSTFATRLQQVEALQNELFSPFIIIPVGVSAESGIITSALADATGPGGPIDISTDQLQVSRLGKISSSTAGPGKAGKIDITALHEISLTNPGSGVFANTTSTGPGGTISFATPNFSVNDGAVVDVRTSGDGPGGNIVVQADRFTARQGGHLVSTTSDQGRAGDITLNVRDDITLTGARSGLFANTTPTSIGAAGSIFIDPIQVLIADGATVSVNSQGAGRGGDIRLQGRNLTLSRGRITAEAKVARAGDIQIDIDDLLLLRKGSLVSTTAGSNATGGNIDIDATLIVAFPQENSDITANALDGSGGKITITTSGLFGLRVEDELTDSSDITAFSQNNPQLDGIVQIKTPGVDPSDNLSEQPEVVEPPAEVARGCKAQVTKSSFVYKGRGGVPQNPAASMGGDAIWRDLRPLRVQVTSQPLGKSSPPSTATETSASQEIRVEAKGWRRLSDDKVMLVAQAVSHSSLPPVASC